MFDDETFTVTVSDCQFAADFTATTSDESGGMSAGRGSVTIEGCAAVLREGDSFVVALESTFTIPAEPSAIEFTYSALSFDTTDPNFINDAFEVAFVERDGNSLVARGLRTTSDLRSSGI